jgi:hypothetical protein
MIHRLGLLALLSASSSALAGTTVSADFGQVFDSQFEQDMALRAGYELPIPAIHIAPEVSARMLRSDDATALGAFVGVRVSIGMLVSPGVYAQTGIWSADQSKSSTGGLSLDFRAVPLAIFGVHGGYTTHDAGNFVSAGAHAGLKF